MLSLEESSILSNPQDPLRNVPVGSGLNIPADLRRYTRSAISSQRSEQLNKIGDNITGIPHPRKEDIPPQSTRPPPWISLTKGHFLSRDLGEDWVTCVGIWFELEGMFGFGEVLGTKGEQPL